MTEALDAGGGRRILGLGLRCGTLTGVLAGIADALLSRGELTEARFLWIAVILWSIASVLVALLLVTLTALVGRAWRLRGPGPAMGHDSSSILSTLVAIGPAIWAMWLIGLVYVNISWLGPASSLSSLLANLLITGACSVLAWWLARLLARRTTDRHSADRSPGWIRPARRFLRSWRGAALIASCSVLMARLTWPVGSSGQGEIGAEPPPSAPNVLLIVIDTLRADHLSQDGYPRPTSPVLDSLARQGTRFSRCISQSSYTKPAVASLLTSSYLSQHRAGHIRSVLDRDRTTLVEQLRRGGYRTAMVVANPVISREAGFARGAELFKTLESPLGPRTTIGYVVEKLADERLGLPLAPGLNQAMIDLERALLGTRGSEVQSLAAGEVIAAFEQWHNTLDNRPFFAYLHLMEPHAPYLPTQEALHRLGLGDALLTSSYPHASGVFLPFTGAPAVSEPQRQGMIRAYDGEISAADLALQRLIPRFLEPSAGRSTMIIVTSDHGEEFYDHGAWGHGHSLHQELITVPLLMAGQGIPAGRSVDSTVELIDVGPTLLDLIGLTPMKGTSGRSLANLLGRPTDRPLPEHRDEALPQLHYGNTYWARSLIRGDLKLIQARLGARQHVALVDLSADPGEHHNLASERPELLAALLARLDELAGPPASQPDDEALRLDTTTEDRLRQLGYLD